MSDLLFRAGIDDTPFRSGLKRLVKSGEDAAKSLQRKGGIGGMLGEAATGFRAGLGFFGAQQAIRMIGQSWAYARKELDEYAKVNRSSGVRQDQSKSIQELSNRNIGRLLDRAGVREAWQDIASSPGRLAGQLLSNRDRNGLIGQEAETRRRDQAQKSRDFVGPLEEDILRMQGRNSAAEVARVRREQKTRLEEIRQLRDSKQIDAGTAFTFTETARRNAAFSELAARRIGTQGIGADIPESLRKQFMGVPQEDRPATYAPKESVAALQDRFNKMNAQDQYRLETQAEASNRTFIQKVFEFSAMWG